MLEIKDDDQCLICYLSLIMFLCFAFCFLRAKDIVKEKKEKEKIIIKKEERIPKQLKFKDPKTGQTYILIEEKN